MVSLYKAALARIYGEFESCCLEEFRVVHMQAADISEAQDVNEAQFAAILKAATGLVAEMDLVSKNIAPCFDSNWGIGVLWSSCVAHICSNQVIQQIGGPEGTALPDLTAIQLLDLMGWVEYFREIVEKNFSYLSMMHAKRTYFDTRPNIFAENKT